MTIKDTLKNDMVTALKSGDKLRLNTLRSALGSITDAETSGKSRKELDDSDIIAVLKKLIKTRRESYIIYTTAGALDRAETEKAESDILETYLPVQLTEDETRVIVEEIIAEKDLQTAGIRGVGQVMKEIKSRNDVDAAVASRIARNILQ